MQLHEDLQCAIIAATEGSETNIRLKEAVNDDGHARVFKKC